MVFEQSEKKTLKKCHFFGSFFWTSKKMNKKEIIIPIEQTTHLIYIIQNSLCFSGKNELSENKNKLLFNHITLNFA